MDLLVAEFKALNARLVRARPAASGATRARQAR
jgi:hypothetical protein